MCLMDPSEVVPVDRVYLSGHNVWCDESGAMGESDTIKKVTYDECIAAHRAYVEAMAHGEQPSGVKIDPFVISSSKGIGSYVATAVGVRTLHEWPNLVQSMVWSQVVVLGFA